MFPVKRFAFPESGTGSKISRLVDSRGEETYPLKLLYSSDSDSF